MSPSGSEPRVPEDSPPLLTEKPRPPRRGFSSSVNEDGAGFLRPHPIAETRSDSRLGRVQPPDRLVKVLVLGLEGPLPTLGRRQRHRRQAPRSPPQPPFASRLDWPQVERSEAEAIVRRDLPTCVEEILALMPIEPPADDFRHRLYEEMFQPSVAGILDGTVLLVDGRMTMKVVASAQSGPNPKAN
jgi:hypothetical protein